MIPLRSLAEVYRSERGTLMKTEGHRNGDLEITKFENNVQPFYVISTTDEKVLATALHLPGAEVVVEFLEKGLKEYRR